MSIDIPGDAQCLGCGYMLRDLNDPVCPECARGFDPEDATTYNIDPQRRRRRMIKRLVISGVALIGLAVLLWPRGINRAQITFVDIATSNTIVVKRWEPVSPSWIPFRYPGLRWTTGRPDDSQSPEDVQYSVSATSQDARGGKAMVSASMANGEVMAVNGIPGYLENAVAILRELTSNDDLMMQTNILDGTVITEDP